MSNLIGVNAADIEVSNTGGGDPLIAPGLHPAIITHIEEGSTENGNEYIDYYFAINGGVNTGSTIRSREWPNSTSEAGQDIYKKKLKSLLTICGVEGALTSLDQICGKQMLINNKPRPRKDEPGQMQNSINYYRSYDPSAKLAVAVAVVAPPPAAPLPMPQMGAPVAAPAPVAPAVAIPAPQAIPAPVAAPQPIPAPMAAPQPIPAPVAAPAPQAQAIPQPGQPVQVAPIPQPVAQPQAIPQPAPIPSP